MHLNGSQNSRPDWQVLMRIPRFQGASRTPVWEDYPVLTESFKRFQSVTLA